jgi:hypothetical protein
VRQYAVLFVLLTLVACGETQPPAPAGEAVWKSQMEVLEKAGDVEEMISEGSARQRSLIDQQAQ